MRHRNNKLLKLNTGSKKKTVFIRSLLSSLVAYNKVTTTPKRAKVLKAEADSLFSKLVQLYDAYENEKDAQRECVRVIKSTIYGEEAGKKLLNELLPKFRSSKKTSGFVADYKVWFRVGDWSLKVLVTIV